MKKLSTIGAGVVLLSSIFIQSASAGYWDISETRIQIRENRVQAQTNVQDFKSTYQGEITHISMSLTEEQKADLQEVQSEFHEEMQQFEGLITSDTRFYEKEEIYSEMKEVIALYVGKIEYIVQDNVEASAYVDDRYNLFQTNEELREDTRKTWYDYVDSIINDLIQ